VRVERELDLEISGNWGDDLERFQAEQIRRNIVQGR